MSRHKHSWEKMLFPVTIVIDSKDKTIRYGNLDSFEYDDTNTFIGYVRIGRKCSRCRKQIDYPSNIFLGGNN